MLQKDIKLLWGRAGNRCSKCRCELSQDAAASNAAFTLGEQAHIVGEKEGLPDGQTRSRWTSGTAITTSFCCARHITQRSIKTRPIGRSRSFTT